MFYVLSLAICTSICTSFAQVYRAIRVILESSLESEILRTLRTPSLSDNETLKTLRTHSLMTLRLLRLCGLRVFGGMGLWHTSDLESFEVCDSYILQTSSLSDLETLIYFRLRVFQGPRLSVLSRLRVSGGCRLFVLLRLPNLSDFETLRTFRLRNYES